MDFTDAAFRVLMHTRTQARPARPASRWMTIAAAFRHYQTNIVPHQLRVAEAQIVEARANRAARRRGDWSALTNHRVMDTPAVRESLRIVDAYRRQPGPRSAEQSVQMAEARREFDEFMRHGLRGTVRAARAYGYHRLADSQQQHLDAMVTPDELGGMVREAILDHAAALAGSAWRAYIDACRQPASTMAEQCYQVAARAVAARYFDLWAAALIAQLTEE